MSSTTITITKFNGTNYAQWATEMALLLKQNQVYGIIKGYDEKPEEPEANATATKKAAFKDCMNRHGVARSTILLGMEPRMQAEYTVVKDEKTLSDKLASAYKSKLQLNIFEIREDLWSIKLQDCGDIDNYASQIDRKVKDYNLCAGPSTTDNDATDTDSAKTIAKMSKQEPIFNLLRGIPRNNEWKVFLELMMDKNATMTPRPMRSSPSSLKRKLQSRERLGLLQKLCSLQRKVAEAAEAAKSAKVQRRTREIIREIIRETKRRISGSTFIASGEGTQPRTPLASSAAILPRLPILQQKHQLKHQLLRLSPLRSRTSGWWPAQMLHPVIGSSIADAQLTSPAINQCSSPTPNILRIRRRSRDKMGSHRLYPDMGVLG